MSSTNFDPRPNWASIPEMAEAAAARCPDAIAVVDGDIRMTYAELLSQSRRFAAALAESGVQPQDHVAIWLFNCREWIVALLGLLQAGATLVPINTRFKGREAAEILRRARVRVLVTVSEFLGNDYVAMLAGSGVPLPDLRTVVVARGRASAPAVGWADFMARATASGLAEVERRQMALGPDDPSDVLFTSGTTGRPKGVLMSHGRTMRIATDWVAMTGLASSDNYLMINPYFHMFGLKGGVLASIAAAATMVPQAVFDIDRVLATVAEQKITVLPGPPTLFHALLDHPDLRRYDLSSLRIGVTGASDIPVELIRRVLDELPFTTVVSGYGLTEAGTATSTSSGDRPETIAGTAGRLRPGFEMRIRKPSGADAGPGEIGEILLRGPTTMVGYLDAETETAEVLSPDGWLRTGDLGFIDQDGLLHVAGRLKDMFIVGGFNTYPAEIESILLEHPSVGQAAVIGVPDERLGEVGMAFIVRRSPELTEEELTAWCRHRMANYKVPRFVVFVDELPLNATGKVQKDVLRAQASRSRPGAPR